LLKETPVNLDVFSLFFSKTEKTNYVRFCGPHLVSYICLLTAQLTSTVLTGDEFVQNHPTSGFFKGICLFVGKPKLSIFKNGQFVSLFFLRKIFFFSKNKKQFPTFQK
jgi:hypothetical protein